MPAVILTSEMESLSGYSYKVEIINNATATPTANTFVCSDYTLTYNPETNRATGQIIPSILEIYAINEGGYFNNTFVADLQDYQQDKYLIKLYKDTGSGYVLNWFGWILQDQSEEVEASQPRTFKITATDGLAMLKDIKYNNSNSDAFYTTPIYKILINALALNNLTSAVGASGDWLITSADYWEDSMSYGVTTDPLTLAFLDVRVWNIFNEWWERDYANVYDVLQQICVTYGARLYLSGGSYRFEQYCQRIDPTFREVAYRYNYTQNSATNSASREFEVLANDSLLSSRLKDNLNSYLPAIKKCKIEFNKLFMTDAVGQFNFNQSSYSAQEIGFSETIDDSGLSVTVDYFGFVSDSSMVVAKLTEFVFEITLSSEDVSGTFWYWDGADWIASTSTITFSSVQKRADSNKTYMAAGTFHLLTTEWPSGNLTIQVELIEVNQKSLTSPTWTTISSPSTLFWSAAANIELDNEDNESNGAVYYATTSNANIGDEEELLIGTTNIGDGLLQTGKLWIKSSVTSGTISKSTNWRIGNTGTYQPILNLTCQTIQAFYSKPLHLYGGVIKCSEDYSTRINFDSQYFLPLNLTFSVKMGEWSGQYWEISSDLTGITAQTTLQKRRQIFRRPNANVNALDIPNGRIGGVQIEQDTSQVDGYVEATLTPAQIALGITAQQLIPAAGAGYFISVSKVVLVKTGGTTPYASGAAKVYFASETTNVIDAAQFVAAINNGYNKQFNTTDAIKMFENEALLLDIAANAAGDYEYTLKIYYKTINL